MLRAATRFRSHRPALRSLARAFSGEGNAGGARSSILPPPPPPPPPKAPSAAPAPPPYLREDAKGINRIWAMAAIGLGGFLAWAYKLNEAERAGPMHSADAGSSREKLALAPFRGQAMPRVDVHGERSRRYDTAFRGVLAPQHALVAPSRPHVAMVTVELSSACQPAAVAATVSHIDSVAERLEAEYGHRLTAAVAFDAALWKALRSGKQAVADAVPKGKKAKGKKKHKKKGGKQAIQLLISGDRCLDVQRCAQAVIRALPEGSVASVTEAVGSVLHESSLRDSVDRREKLDAAAFMPTTGGSFAFSREWQFADGTGLLAPAEEGDVNCLLIGYGGITSRSCRKELTFVKSMEETAASTVWYFPSQAELTGLRC